MTAKQRILKEEAMSVGLAKACVPRKKLILFKRN